MAGGMGSTSNNRGTSYRHRRGRGEGEESVHQAVGEAAGIRHSRCKPSFPGLREREEGRTCPSLEALLRSPDPPLSLTSTPSPLLPCLSSALALAIWKARGMGFGMTQPGTPAVRWNPSGGQRGGLTHCFSSNHSIKWQTIPKQLGFDFLGEGL